MSASTDITIICPRGQLVVPLTLLPEDLKERFTMVDRLAVALNGWWDDPEAGLVNGLVEDLRRLHSRRDFSGDGYGWSLCAECRQVWPCATEQAIAKAMEADR